MNLLKPRRQQHRFVIANFERDKYMTKIVFTFLFLIPTLSFGQFSHLGKTEPSDEPDIHYYKFYNGIQMIEFDYLSAYHRKVNFLEQAQPRALTWEMVLGPPHSNVYLFRNESGEIVKQYGDADKTKLLSIKESLKIAMTHNSFAAQIGSVVGFTQITTRYFPYYLIGSKYELHPDSLGLIDSLGNEVLPKEYSVIWKHDNIFITRKDKSNELRDINLTVKFSSNEFLLQPAQFHRGFADIFKDNKCGLMDSTGKIIVSCEYDMNISNFNEFGFAKVEKNGKVGFVDTKGKEVIDCKYQNAGDFIEGLLNVRLNDKWGYIDANGKTIIPHKYEIGGSFVKGLAQVAKREAGQYYFGFIDKEGNEVIPLVYSKAKDFKNGIAEVMIDGKWIKIDTTGKKLK
jgi:hypothetical protein